MEELVEGEESHCDRVGVLSSSVPTNTTSPRSMSLDESQSSSSLLSLESTVAEDLSKLEKPLTAVSDPRPSSVLSSGSTSSTASPKSLFSRLSKTLEDRISKIRSEKSKAHNYSSHLSDDPSHISFMDDEFISFSQLASESKKDELYSQVPDNSPCDPPSPISSPSYSEETETPAADVPSVEIKPPSSAKLFEVRFRNWKEGRSCPGISLDSSMISRDMTPLDSAIEDGVEAAEETMLSILNDKSVQYSASPEKSNGNPEHHAKTANGHHQGELQKNNESIINKFSSIEKLTSKTSNMLQCYWRRICFGTILFVVCFVLPLPSFLSGIIFGCTISISIAYYLSGLFLPSTPERPYQSAAVTLVSQAPELTSPCRGDLILKVSLLNLIFYCRCNIQFVMLALIILIRAVKWSKKVLYTPCYDNSFTLFCPVTNILGFHLF